MAKVGGGPKKATKTASAGPLVREREGTVEITLWKGQKGYSFSIQKSYRPKGGDWVTQRITLFPRELSRLISAMNRFLENKDVDSVLEESAEDSGEESTDSSESFSSHSVQTNEDVMMDENEDVAMDDNVEDDAEDDTEENADDEEFSAEDIDEILYGPSAESTESDSESETKVPAIGEKTFNALPPAIRALLLSRDATREQIADFLRILQFVSDITIGYAVADYVISKRATVGRFVESDESR